MHDKLKQLAVVPIMLIQLTKGGPAVSSMMKLQTQLSLTVATQPLLNAITLLGSNARGVDKI